MVRNKNLDKAREKALLSPNIGKRGPHKKTLLKRKAVEEAIKGLAVGYQREILKHYPDVFKVHVDQAKDEKGWKDREFFLKKAVGVPDDEKTKPEQHLHIHADPDMLKLIEEYELKLKEALIKNRHEG